MATYPIFFTLVVILDFDPSFFHFAVLGCLLAVFILLIDELSNQMLGVWASQVKFVSFALETPYSLIDERCHTDVRYLDEFDISKPKIFEFIVIVNAKDEKIYLKPEDIPPDCDSRFLEYMKKIGIRFMRQQSLGKEARRCLQQHKNILFTQLLQTDDMKKCMTRALFARILRKVDSFDELMRSNVLHQRQFLIKDTSSEDSDDVMPLSYIEQVYELFLTLVRSYRTHNEQLSRAPKKLTQILTSDTARYDGAPLSCTSTVKNSEKLVVVLETVCGNECKSTEEDLEEGLKHLKITSSENDQNELLEKESISTESEGAKRPEMKKNLVPCVRSNHANTQKVGNRKKAKHQASGKNKLNHNAEVIAPTQTSTDKERPKTFAPNQKETEEKRAELILSTQEKADEEKDKVFVATQEKIFAPNQLKEKTDEECALVLLSTQKESDEVKAKIFTPTPEKGDEDVANVLSPNPGKTNKKTPKTIALNQKKSVKKRAVALPSSQVETNKESTEVLGSTKNKTVEEQAKVLPSTQEKTDEVKPNALSPTQVGTDQDRLEALAPIQNKSDEERAKVLPSTQVGTDDKIPKAPTQQATYETEAKVLSSSQNETDEEESKVLASTQIGANKERLAETHQHSLNPAVLSSFPSVNIVSSQIAEVEGHLSENKRISDNEKPETPPKEFENDGKKHNEKQKATIAEVDKSVLVETSSTPALSSFSESVMRAAREIVTLRSMPGMDQKEQETVLAQCLEVVSSEKFQAIIMENEELFSGDIETRKDLIQTTLISSLGPEHPISRKINYLDKFNELHPALGKLHEEKVKELQQDMPKEKREAAIRAVAEIPYTAMVKNFAASLPDGLAGIFSNPNLEMHQKNIDRIVKMVSDCEGQTRNSTEQKLAGSQQTNPSINKEESTANVGRSKILVATRRRTGGEKAKVLASTQKETKEQNSKLSASTQKKTDEVKAKVLSLNPVETDVKIPETIPPNEEKTVEDTCTEKETDEENSKVLATTQEEIDKVKINVSDGESSKISASTREETDEVESKLLALSQKKTDKENSKVLAYTQKEINEENSKVSASIQKETDEVKAKVLSPNPIGIDEKIPKTMDPNEKKTVEEAYTEKGLTSTRKETDEGFSILASTEEEIDELKSKLLALSVKEINEENSKILASTEEGIDGLKAEIPAPTEGETDERGLKVPLAPIENKSDEETADVLSPTRVGMDEKKPKLSTPTQKRANDKNCKSSALTVEEFIEIRENLAKMRLAKMEKKTAIVRGVLQTPFAAMMRQYAADNEDWCREKYRLAKEEQDKLELEEERRELEEERQELEDERQELEDERQELEDERQELEKQRRELERQRRDLELANSKNEARRAEIEKSLMNLLVPPIPTDDERNEVLKKEIDDENLRRRQGNHNRHLFGSLSEIALEEKSEKKAASPTEDVKSSPIVEKPNTDNVKQETLSKDSGQDVKKLTEAKEMEKADKSEKTDNTTAAHADQEGVQNKLPEKVTVLTEVDQAIEEKPKTNNMKPKTPSKDSGQDVKKLTEAKEMEKADKSEKTDNITAAHADQEVVQNKLPENVTVLTEVDQAIEEKPNTNNVKPKTPSKDSGQDVKKLTEAKEMEKADKSEKTDNTTAAHADQEVVQNKLPEKVTVLTEVDQAIEEKPNSKHTDNVKPKTPSKELKKNVKKHTVDEQKRMAYLSDDADNFPAVLAAHEEFHNKFRNKLITLIKMEEEAKKIADTKKNSKTCFGSNPAVTQKVDDREKAEVVAPTRKETDKGKPEKLASPQEKTDGERPKVFAPTQVETKGVKGKLEEKPKLPTESEEARRAEIEKDLESFLGPDPADGKKNKVLATQEEIDDRKLTEKFRRVYHNQPLFGSISEIALEEKSEKKAASQKNKGSPTVGKPFSDHSKPEKSIKETKCVQRKLTGKEEERRAEIEQNLLKLLGPDDEITQRIVKNKKARELAEAEENTVEILHQPASSVLSTVNNVLPQTEVTRAIIGTTVKASHGTSFAKQIAEKLKNEHNKSSTESNRETVAQNDIVEKPQIPSTVVNIQTSKSAKKSNINVEKLDGNVSPPELKTLEKEVTENRSSSSLPVEERPSTNETTSRKKKKKRSNRKQKAEEEKDADEILRATYKNVSVHDVPPEELGEYVYSKLDAGKTKCGDYIRYLWPTYVVGVDKTEDKTDHVKESTTHDEGIRYTHPDYDEEADDHHLKVRMMMAELDKAHEERRERRKLEKKSCPGCHFHSIVEHKDVKNEIARIIASASDDREEKLQTIDFLMGLGREPLSEIEEEEEDEGHKVVENVWNDLAQQLSCDDLRSFLMDRSVICEKPTVAALRAAKGKQKLTHKDVAKANAQQRQLSVLQKCSEFMLNQKAIEDRLKGEDNGEPNLDDPEIDEITARLILAHPEDVTDGKSISEELEATFSEERKRREPTAEEKTMESKQRLEISMNRFKRYEKAYRMFLMGAVHFPDYCPVDEKSCRCIHCTHKYN